MAINLQSPGIKITEADQVASIGSIGTTTGALVGEFTWGPINDAVFVTRESELVSKFGIPSASSNVDFLTAASYLAYSSSAYVVRAGDSAARNATSSGTGLLVENDEGYESATKTGAGHWIARHAGSLGNSLKVVICENSTGFSDPAFAAYKGFFDVAPGTSDYVSNLGGSNDELHVAVIDEDGEFTGIPGSLLEKFELVSKASDARGIDGGSNYYVTVINETSKYIRWANHVETNARNATISGAVFAAGEITFTTSAPHNFLAGESVVVADVVDSGAASAFDGTFTIDSVTSTTFVVTTADPVETYVSGGTANVAGTANWGTAANGTTFTDGDGTNVHDESLTGGIDTTLTNTERFTAWDVFSNTLNYDVDVLIGGEGDAAMSNYVGQLAESRKDCVACLTPPKAAVYNNVDSEVADIQSWADALTRSTYVVVDANWKYMYDRYNDSYTYVPCNPDVAGCMARVDFNRSPWVSPAGYENGRILNSVRLAWNPTNSQRDELYKYGINPIISSPGRGTVLFGDKTFTQKKTSFSRINVRRLFITMQSVIGEAADDVLFEQNDSSTRAGFTALVEAYLRTVEAGSGITQFRVVCDDTNNPDEVVNANEFVCDIFVRPIATVNFIQLNFVSVAGASAFSESE